MNGQWRIKRSLDIVIAGGALLVLSPVLAIVSLMVLQQMGRPVLFRQVRPGYRGEPFEVLKFRTMLHATGPNGEFLSDAERLTPLGRFLRRTSLDELPQLWNVVRGEMSLVGPRPLLIEYLDRYTADQTRRHEVKPGITGLAQISGRQDIPFSKRIKLDVWYVDHWSLWLDIKILIRSIRQVLASNGVRPGQDVKEVDDLDRNVRRAEKGARRCALTNPE